ncbi:hypothetical protein [Gottfriedia solisilvae]|uniref:Uncharacterized protein n=1 Tax=Gottfriedia solisilvae TaxID=1516104 RepID=A0A8J3F2A5_9BACI|nr:hypothetical protein [Gottfriedia solisilvae]GGI17779.1 hypothetical protein GCM10007380_39640 [Gottfriedia solisilvae]
MGNLNYEEKEAILDFFGKLVIENVRDRDLSISMEIANGTTVNPIKKEQYKALSTLNEEQKEAVCDLLSETITSTIFNFLDMIEVNNEKMKLLVCIDGIDHDLCKISEKMGSEIAFDDEDGWIQKFSSIGRFV